MKQFVLNEEEAELVVLCLPEETKLHKKLRSFLDDKPLLRTYQDRKPRLDIATAHLEELVKEYPGRTQLQLSNTFPIIYNYACTTYGNKLRKLRKEGKITSSPGKDGLLKWYPKETIE